MVSRKLTSKGFFRMRVWARRFVTGRLSRGFSLLSQFGGEKSGSFQVETLGPGATVESDGLRITYLNFSNYLFRKTKHRQAM